MPKMTDDDVLGVIEGEESSAYGYLSGVLSKERAQAMDYYLGKPFGNEVEGRSQVVLTDVADTIEWVLPSLMRIFMSGDEIVTFTPVSQEDKEPSEQETQYVNHVIMQKNSAFVLFYSWFKDALLQKNGYVMAEWVEKEDNTKETYHSLSDDELNYILTDSDVEPIEHSMTETEHGPRHDVKVMRKKNVGCVKAFPVPPDELLVSTRHTAVSLADAPFVQHRTRKTLSEIRQMGYDVDDDIADDDSYITQEKTARQRYNEFEDNSKDPSMREVTFKKNLIRMDYDGDGIAELRRVVVVGKTIIENEEADSINYYALTPVIMSHQHIGLSYADLIMDLMLIRSTLLRQGLDNLYLANNGRHAVNEDRVNLDDMLTSRPGGMVRCQGDPGSAIVPLIHPNTGMAALQMLEFTDGVKENRTGITKYNQGLDSNSLNKTMGGITQIMNAAQQRIELIARIFAETGVKDFFLGVHELLLKHSKEQQVVMLRNKWVPVDPRQWTKRTDMTVSVGLGTGNKDQMLSHLTTILGVQEKALQIGVATPKNIYNTAAKLAENAGFKIEQEFFTDPDEQQQQQPNPETEQMKAALQQMQQQIAALKQEKQFAKMTEKLRAEQASLAVQEEQVARATDALKFKEQLIEKSLELKAMEEDARRTQFMGQVEALTTGTYGQP